MRHLTESAKLKLLIGNWKGLSNFCRIFWILKILFALYTSHKHVHMHIGIKELQWGVSTNFQPQKVFGELCRCHAHTHVYRCLGASVCCVNPISVSEGIWWVIYVMHTLAYRCLRASLSCVNQFLSQGILWVSMSCTHVYRCLGTSVSCVDPIPVSVGILWVIISMSCTHTCV